MIACFTGGVFLHGVTALSATYVVTAMCHVYILIVIYSLYEKFEMETYHVQQELHTSAASQDYTQSCKQEVGKEPNGA